MSHTSGEHGGPISTTNSPISGVEMPLHAGSGFVNSSVPIQGSRAPSAVSGDPSCHRLSTERFVRRSPALASSSRLYSPGTYEPIPGLFTSTNALLSPSDGYSDFFSSLSSSSRTIRTLEFNQDPGKPWSQSSLQSPVLPRSVPQPCPGSYEDFWMSGRTTPGASSAFNKHVRVSSTAVNMSGSSGTAAGSPQMNQSHSILLSLKSTPGTPTRGMKRKRTEHCNENRTTDNSLSPSRVNLPAPKKKRMMYTTQTINEKIDIVLDAIKTDARWTFAEFLYHFSQFDTSAAPLHRSIRHGTTMQRFLSGKDKYTPAEVIHAWIKSPDGMAPEDSKFMYSSTTPYTELRSAREALSSFAVQTVERKLIREAKAAIKVSSGLHATVETKTGLADVVQWVDIGATTVPRVAEILQRILPVTWHLFLTISTPIPRTRNGVIPVRKFRPAEPVCADALSSLLMRRSNKARLLPFAKGILYFACSVPFDIIAYNSRVGNMPAYTTIWKSLIGLSKQESFYVENHGRDKTKWGRIIMDNVQNYHKQRDMRIGRENVMNIGIAATYVEIEDFKIRATDFEDKRKRILENKRSNLTVEGLISFIDQTHIETVGRLEWMNVLIRYIPELQHYRSLVSDLYRTRAAKQKIPLRKTMVHPLATSGKNETVMTELKDALLDFFSQVGQKDGDYLHRLLCVGGDGLTFERLVQLKNYMQAHEDPFQSLALVNPLLEWWHTFWTNLSRLTETHFDSSLSPDPSTLGHSASKIGRPAPSNLKKVDFYPTTELVGTVLDSRILDCWSIYFKTDDIFAYFTKLAMDNNIPPFEDLEAASRILYRTYSSRRAYYHALSKPEDGDAWSMQVPTGKDWIPPISELSSLDQGTAATKGKGKKGKKSKATDDKDLEPFLGDRVLAQSILFMHDAMLAREANFAAAEGDVGRVWEVLKTMVVTFAGSSHSKYTTYLLETICNLELESNIELREVVLGSLLINLSGREGEWSPGDLVQEFFNRCLEAIVERKSAEFGATFIRNVVSRNLHHFCRLKSDWKIGVGLCKRSSQHSEPHTNPEIRTLLQEYRDQQLHYRRSGRSYSNTRDVDNFACGMKQLRDTKLNKFILQSTRARGLTAGDTYAIPIQNPEDVELDEGEEDGDSEMTTGTMRSENGELVIETYTSEELAEAYMALMEAEEVGEDAMADEEEPSEDEL